MRKFSLYKTLAMLAAIATILTAIHQITLSYITINSGNDTITVPWVKCDWTTYAPTVRKLQAAPKSATDRYVWLGADPNFTYYYDYEADDVTCTLQHKPLRPQLHPSTQAVQREKPNRAVFVVLLSLVVIAAIALEIVRYIRRKDPSQK